MSDEEKAAAREKHRELKQQRRETWKNMSEEEKAAARQHMRDKGREHGARRHRQQ